LFIAVHGFDSAPAKIICPEKGACARPPSERHLLFDEYVAPTELKS